MSRCLLSRRTWMLWDGPLLFRLDCLYQRFFLRPFASIFPPQRTLSWKGCGRTKCTGRNFDPLGECYRREPFCDKYRSTPRLLRAKGVLLSRDMRIISMRRPEPIPVVFLTRVIDWFWPSFLVLRFYDTTQCQKLPKPFSVISWIVFWGVSSRQSNLTFFFLGGEVDMS